MLKRSCLLLFLCLGLPALHATYIFKHGKLIKSDEVATLSVQEHYSAALEAYQQENWDELIHQALVVVKNFESTPFSADGYYYLGVGYYHTEELEFANRCFSKYLKKQIAPKYFEEAIEYKFKIAERYHRGAKKHLFGAEPLPKWLPAQEEAIAIYDEVITALPHHDLAAYALFGKAQLQLKEEEYKASIETYQTLIRRFPKHPLAAEGYVGIQEVYLLESQQAYPDQDFLDLAQINLRKFRQDFPGEEKVGVAESTFLKMKEVYASDLYDVARFYERTHKPQAAYLYYTRIRAKYPETTVAGLAGKRLDKMSYVPPQTQVPTQESPAAPPESSSPLLELQPQGLTVHE
jgi:outer membrane protein assembly factor BamD (BamD/ComL family)